MASLTRSVRIRNAAIYADTELVFQSETSDFDTFSLEAYRNFKIDYPKFHKMDRLSKLGFLAGEVVLANSKLLEKYSPFEVGIILSNKSSSLDTDVRYSEALKKGIASPAVFVYSLPNIVIGELCIRHGFKGENTFFVSDKYQLGEQQQYIELLLNSNVLKACVGGWVELMGEDYEAFVFLTEANDKEEFTAEKLEEVYLQKF